MLCQILMNTKYSLFVCKDSNDERKPLTTNQQVIGLQVEYFKFVIKHVYMAVL
jgi:hypothetical protein